MLCAHAALEPIVLTPTAAIQRAHFITASPPLMYLVLSSGGMSNSNSGNCLEAKTHCGRILAEVGHRATSDRRATFASQNNNRPIFDYLVAAEFITLVHGSDMRHRGFSAAD
jgi:hypothetical protein